jgi:phosphosulfolactate synthase
LGCTHAEVSNGTIHLPNEAKAHYISRLAEEFVVLSEVGYKDNERSDALGAEQWIEFIHEDLDAGASYTVTEARESGHSGICDASGALRFDVVEQIVSSDIDTARLVFESPTKDLQTFFVTRIGADVNLANISLLDVIGVETLRLGLRSDTLLHFELERQHLEGAEPLQGVSSRA